MRPRLVVMTLLAAVAVVVACRRGEPSRECPGGRFSVHDASDTVTERGAWRTWQRRPLPKRMTWDEARAACAALHMRLPTLGEVVALADPPTTGGTLDTCAFASTTPDTTPYAGESDDTALWTSSRPLVSSGLTVMPEGQRVAVRFAPGLDSENGGSEPIDARFRVRCVKDDL